jgi:hypothetical protein
VQAQVQPRAKQEHRHERPRPISLGREIDQSELAAQDSKGRYTTVLADSLFVRQAYSAPCRGKEAGK